MSNHQNKTYYIKTYGCQMNKTDSERIAADLEKQGYQLASSWKNCDQIILNTCAVRKRVEDRVRAFIHKISAYYQEQRQPKPKIILTGCMIHHSAEKLRQMEPDIDEVLDIQEVGFNINPKRTDKKHAFVPISTGCNSFCSYCIVPYARGPEKSRLEKEILTEIQALANQGYQEITLLGQNVNSWGLEKIGVSIRKMLLHDSQFTRDKLPTNQSQYLQPNGIPPFVKLLREISAIKQIKVIRFLSANPWDFHDELIEEIGHNKKIDRYIHLPVQSGSNSVLHRMNRGYTREDYLQIIAKLKQADPEITMGTDLIIGFPGETDEEFQDTVKLAQAVNWQVGFINKYSPRPGTAANKLYQDDVPDKVKHQRWHILEKLINQPHLKHRPKVV
jgi:tRNA-2-methylthio-N6-dimethylallyladenosine synthase